MKEQEALHCLEQFLQGMSPLAQKAADPFGPDIFYAEDIAEQFTPELIEQCSTAIGVLRLRISTRRKSVHVTPAQFTRDDVARISASAINRVLEKLSVQHCVAGIAVFLAGEGVCLVDIVMRDNTVNE